MFNIFLYDIFFIPFAVLPHSLVSFRYEYILLLNPMNSLIGIPDTSSLNFPITFLFDLSKYGEISGYSPLPKGNSQPIHFVRFHMHCVTPADTGHTIPHF